MPVESVFDYLDAAVVVLDAEGRVVVWNRRCEELVGHSKEEAAAVLEREGVLGPAWYHDGRRSMLLAEKVVDAPEYADEEYGISRVDGADFTLYGDTSSFVDTNGEERHIEFTAAPMYDGRRFVGVIEMVQIDVETERERELNSLVAEMRQSMQAARGGDLSARVDPGDTDYIEEELMQVVGSFNEMMETLDGVAHSIRRNAQELGAVTEEVTAATDEIAAVTDEQEDRLRGVDSEVTDLSATIQEVASTTSEVAATSAEADEFASQVHASATDTLQRMNGVADAAERMQEAMRELATHLEEVSEVVDVIDDIADQTNMLALNASIEAARAGEAGDGFGVVADEVKSLAEKSQENASEIERTVETLRDDADRTIAGLEETAEELGDGTEMVEAVLNDIVEISEAVADVDTGISQVSAAADDQARATQEITRIVDEAVEQAQTVTDEVDSIAEATDRQMHRTEEVLDSVAELTADPDGR